MTPEAASYSRHKNLKLAPALWGSFEWYNGDLDKLYLKRGLCFATEEDAVAAAKAMMPIKEEA